jgi:hypothetical protein
MDCKSASFAEGNAKNAGYLFPLLFCLQGLFCHFGSLEISSPLASPLQIKGIKRREEKR